MKDINFIVESNVFLSKDIFELKLKSAEGKLAPARCGQFLHLQIPQSDKTILRRPFCLYRFDDTSVTLLIAKIGRGTEQLSHLKVGQTVKAIMPIGNGFTLTEKHKRVVLLGGGVGGAPLYAVPQCYPNKEYYSYIGFSSKEAVLLEEDFKSVLKTVVCTDDGSYGEKGFATDVLRRDLADIKPDVILVCGPTAMFKAAARLAAEFKIPAYVSVEARMGCGVGACLVCTCAVKDKEGQLNNKRACVDGPVFSLEELVL